MDNILPDEVNRNLLDTTNCDYSKSFEFLKGNGCGELKYDLEGALFFDVKELKAMNYENANLKRASFYKTSITNCIFRGAALTGAKFEDCVIENSDFYGSDLEHSSFKNCKIILPKNFGNIGLNDAFIYNCIFENTQMDTVTASNAYFKSTSFINSSIVLSTFENALFEECVFTNLDFSMLNNDYIEFIDPKMERCILPLMSIAYTIGGLDYIFNTNDNISFKGGNEEEMSLVKYKQEFPPNLIIYFEYKKEYFPLANILFAQKKHDEALRAIRTGVLVALQIKDYRQVKFFCKMLKRYNGIGFDELKKFYSLVISVGSTTVNTTEDYRNFTKHMSEIQAILDFPTKNQAGISFELQTNIDVSQTDKITILLRNLYFLESEIFTENHQLKISLSHNSDILVNVDAVGNEDEVNHYKENINYIANKEKSDNILTANNIKNSTITLADKSIININIVLVNQVINELEINQIVLKIKNILQSNMV